MAPAIVSVIHKATLRGGPVVYTTPKEGNPRKILNVVNHIKT